MKTKFNVLLALLILLGGVAVLCFTDCVKIVGSDSRSVVVGNLPARDVTEIRKRNLGSMSRGRQTSALPGLRVELFIAAPLHVTPKM